MKDYNYMDANGNKMSSGFNIPAAEETLAENCGEWWMERSAAKKGN